MNETIEEPLISIVVPVYGIERYIGLCIESILNQTYKNLEIVLVDDGSPDRCPEICDLYARKDSRIKVIHKKNGGLVSARKSGLQVSHGEYVGYVDGDDWIGVGFYSSMYTAIVSSDADVVCAGYSRELFSKCVRFTNYIPSGIYEGKQLVELKKSMASYGEFYRPGITTYVWNKLFKRSILYNHQMAVDERITIGEDAAVTYPTLMDSAKVCVGYTKNRLLLGAMMWFDKFSCKRSNLVITVGRDLGETIEKRFKSSRRVPKYTIINNWINEKEIYPLDSKDEKVVAFRKKYGLEDKFVFMYSGNIGLYYDLEGIIKVIEKFDGARTPQTEDAPDGKEVVFVFVGSGTIERSLQTYVQEHEMKNVMFIPYQDKADLIYSLNAGDVHFCVNAKGIKGVSCPSKFYGLAAVGKPVLGVLEKGSEVRCLIEEIGCGLITEPGDYKGVEDEIRWFIEKSSSGELEHMGEKNRAYLVENLTEKISVEKYKRAILAL